MYAVDSPILRAIQQRQVLEEGNKMSISAESVGLHKDLDRFNELIDQHEKEGYYTIITEQHLSNGSRLSSGGPPRELVKVKLTDSGVELRGNDV